MNLNQHTTYFGDYPPIDLSTEELKNLVIKQFTKDASSFNFSSFTNYSLLSYLKMNNIGLVIPPNTTYQGGLDTKDCSRVREIIWDLIIERYLTVGSHGQDSWPNFSITERGRAYFNELNAQKT
jgi:hypothetical protein